MRHTALLAFLVFFSSCHGNTHLQRQNVLPAIPETLAAASTKITDQPMLEVSVPTKMKRKERIFFRISLVEMWDKEIDKDSISIRLATSRHVILQKKSFVGRDANSIADNRTLVFTSLLVALRKGPARIYITARFDLCDRNNKCTLQRVVREVKFLIE